MILSYSVIEQTDTEHELSIQSLQSSSTEMEAILPIDVSMYFFHLSHQIAVRTTDQ